MNYLINKIKSLSLGTKIRTILQILAYINQGLALFKATPLSNYPAYQWISFGITLVITVLSYWYNNDWTNGAVLISELFNMLKDGKITQEEIKAIINKYNNTNKNNDENKNDDLSYEEKIDLGKIIAHQSVDSNNDISDNNG